MYMYRNVRKMQYKVKVLFLKVMTFLAYFHTNCDIIHVKLKFGDINNRQSKPKVQSRMNNPETLATLGTYEG